MIHYAEQYSGGEPVAEGVGVDGSRTRDDGIQVLRRAAAALDEIATAPGRLRLVDLHTRLGLAKSTARRLLVGLVEVGFAAVDDDGRIVLVRPGREAPHKTVESDSSDSQRLWSSRYIFCDVG